jgi:beta-alanine degradation protein BauB
VQATHTKYLAAVGAALCAFGVIAANGEMMSVSTPVTELKYLPTGVKGNAGELFVATAYGDISNAAHGSFLKMPSGYISVSHAHTHDYHAVVISGVAVNQQGDKNAVSLPVGSYWFQKGGEAHVTKCVSPNECIFFISQPGKFDTFRKQP